MKKLITICAVVGLIFVSNQISWANITNGGFETGDLTGWNTWIPAGGSASAVMTHSESVPPGTGTTSWGPTEGNYFALLKTDGPGSKTQLAQAFTAPIANTPLSFQYFWDSQDYVPFNDTAEGWLSGPGGMPDVMLFSESVNTDPKNYWGTPWTTVHYVIPTPGVYTLRFEVSNGLDSALDSYLGVDNVVIPAPGAILLGSIGAGLVGWLKRRRTL